MKTLTLRGRLAADDHTIWRWLYGETDPEWRRWDGPYFLDKPQPVSWEDYSRDWQNTHHSLNHTAESSRWTAGVSAW